MPNKRIFITCNLVFSILASSLPRIKNTKSKGEILYVSPIRLVRKKIYYMQIKFMQIRRLARTLESFRITY